MARLGDWVRRNSPSRDQIVEHRWLRPFAHRIAHSQLWRFSRRSVPRGAALGLFVGIFLLIPGVQIAGVALLALPFRANIPLGVAMTFLSNPLTTPFIIAGSIWLGNTLFGLHADVTAIDRMVASGAGIGEWLGWLASDAAPALVAGLFVVSAISAVVGYVLASVGWTVWLRLRWRARLRRNRLTAGS